MVWSERAAIQADGEKLWEKLEDGYEASGGVGPAPANFYFTPSGFAEEAQRGAQLHLEELAVEAAGESWLHLGTQPTPNFQGNVPHFVRELQAQVSSGRRALIAGHSPGDVERLADILTENEIGFQLSLKDPFKAASPYLEEKARLAGPLANVMLVESPIRRGVTLPDSNLVVRSASHDACAQQSCSGSYCCYGSRETPGTSAGCGSSVHPSIIHMRVNYSRIHW